eukprot:604774-Amphidinium_carterae.1
MAGWSRLTNDSEALVTAVLQSVYLQLSTQRHNQLHQPRPRLPGSHCLLDQTDVTNTMIYHHYLHCPQLQLVYNNRVQAHPPYFGYDGMYQRAELLFTIMLQHKNDFEKLPQHLLPT